jgi:prepilin-type processing-associated H-X9-DG protein
MNRPTSSFSRRAAVDPRSAFTLIELLVVNWIDLTPEETELPWHDLYAGAPFGGGSMGRCTIPRHGGGNPAQAPRKFSPADKLPGAINVAAADGHAGLVKLEDVWKWRWHANWQTPVQRPTH